MQTLKTCFLDLGCGDVGLWYTPNCSVHERWSDHAVGLLVTLARQHGYQMDVIGWSALHSLAEWRMIAKRYDVICMNVRSWRYAYAKRAAEIAKSANPNVQIWVGGFHATVAPEEMQAVEAFDVIVSKEAEGTFLELLANGGSDKRFIEGSVGAYANMDDLPYIDREVWPKAPGSAWPLESPGGWGPGPRAATMITGRACPFACLGEYSEISLADGRTVPITQIKAGNKVWGRDLISGRPRLQRVRTAKQTYALRYDIMRVQVTGGHFVECTPDHQLLTRRGWIDAQYLTLSDEVLLETRQLYTYEERANSQRMGQGPCCNETTGGIGKSEGNQGYSRISGSTEREKQESVGRSCISTSTYRDGSQESSSRDICQQAPEIRQRTAGDQREDESRQSGQEARSKREDSSNASGQTTGTFTVSEGERGREAYESSCYDASRTISTQATYDYKQSHEEARSCCACGADGALAQPSESERVSREVDSCGSCSEQGRAGASSDNRRAGLSLCGRRQILDRSLSEREMSESRLYLQGRATQDSSPNEWGILAPTTPRAQRQRGNERLCSDGLSSLGYLGEGTERPSSGTSEGQGLAQWAKVTALTPNASSGPVYDLETWPDHNFFANGILVHNCSFCAPAERNHFNVTRRRSVGHVIGELRYIESRWGPVTTVVYHDSEFLINKLWMEEYLNRYPVETPNYPYWASCRADMMMKWPDLVEALHKEANWHCFSIGLESGSQKVLDIMNKQTTVEQNMEAIELVNRLGDEAIVEGRRPPVIFANTMLGIPGEEPEDAFATVRMLGSIKRGIPSLSLFSPYPGSRLGDQMIAEGRSLDVHKRYHRFPTEPKIAGIDYGFYQRLFAGAYDHEIGFSVPAMMARQGSAGEALV